MVHFFLHDQQLPPKRLVDLLPPSLETLCISEWWRENEAVMLAEMMDLVHARGAFPHLSEMTIQGRFLTKRLSPGELMHYQSWPRLLPVTDGRTLEDRILEVTAPLRSSCDKLAVSFSIKDYEVEARAQGHKDPPPQDCFPYSDKEGQSGFDLLLSRARLAVATLRILRSLQDLPDGSKDRKIRSRRLDKLIMIP